MGAGMKKMIMAPDNFTNIIRNTGGFQQLYPHDPVLLHVPHSRIQNQYRAGYRSPPKGPDLQINTRQLLL